MYNLFLSFMKQRRLFLPALCAFASVLCASATDIYFYHHTGDTLVKSVPDVRKIVFNETSTDAVDFRDAVSSVKHDDFDYILFRNKSVSGINGIDSGKGMPDVRFNGTDIIVTSTDSIDKVSIYDVAGHILGVYTSEETTLSISADAFAKGVLIVKVVSGQSVSTSRIIK